MVMDEDALERLARDAALLQARAQRKREDEAARLRRAAEEITAAIAVAKPGLDVLCGGGDVFVVIVRDLRRFEVPALSTERNGTDDGLFEPAFVVDADGQIYRAKPAIEGTAVTVAPGAAVVNALYVAQVVGAGVVDAVVKALSDAIRRGLSAHASTDGPVER